MATEEWIKRAILNNKQYEDLPARVRTVFPVAEYRLKCGPFFCAALREGGNSRSSALACMRSS